ncbi:hypothetical protein [Heyndrickxia acidicola]|uniref:Uncharacterized protein n=1 Tax=Heyndrickxia acidicola TaxID=209389 RepID=A0ABU6MGK2_9BACI|nr:hypothetical protein [Heyndrickxia acidicola]MED1203802.1 hypothetical protein [Heyndrickxia acidicola]
MPISMYNPIFDLIQGLIGADTRDSCEISVSGKTPQEPATKRLPACLAESECLQRKSTSRMIRTLPISM